MRQLPGRDAAEASGSGTLGQALHYLPGKGGKGPALEAPHANLTSL